MKPESSRVDAARQLIELRRTDPKAARDVISLVKPKTNHELAVGLISAVARSDSAEVGSAIVNAMGPMTPAASKASAMVLLGKTEWTNALVSGIDRGKVPLSLLSLSQTQALAAHPDKTIAGRAKALLARGGWPDRSGSREGHPGTGSGRPEGWRRLERERDLQARVLQVPYPFGRGGQGRAEPHRNGRSSQERVARSHTRSESISRGGTSSSTPSRRPTDAL